MIIQENHAASRVTSIIAYLFILCYNHLMKKTVPTQRSPRHKPILQIVIGVSIIALSLVAFCLFSWQDSDLYFLSMSGMIGFPILIIPILLLILAFGIGTKFVLQGVYSLIDKR